MEVKYLMITIWFMLNINVCTKTTRQFKRFTDIIYNITLTTTQENNPEAHTVRNVSVLSIVNFLSYMPRQNILSKSSIL